MRISLNWLRDLVDFSQSAEELADLLTMAGFEVEDIEDRRTWAEGVVVGRVVDRQQHPNADKLSVCQVDIGTGEINQIVCGAANVRADIFVPVATVGSFLPQVGDAGLKIKPAKLRGEPSNGMICSLTELGLTKDSEGIHIFDETIGEDIQPGMDVRPLLGLDEVILDLTSTANRADALSMIGIAREVAALTGNPLKMPQAGDVTATAGTDLTIDIADPQACFTYIGTVIEGVKIGPSPLWLQRRLQAAGVRPISNVVDVTNYIMLEWGQPLHAFDLDRLKQVAESDTLKIGVRFGTAGETLVTLDSQERTATEQTQLITVNDRPVALAGVMGGEATEVFEGTTNLLLEAALFDSAVTRRSARSQGLRSEASARYERGVNLAELELAQRRAVQLITELAGGTVTAQATADHRPATLTRSIELRLDRVKQVLGLVVRGDDLSELEAAEVEKALVALNCQLTATGEGVWTVTVPPYRYRDLEREIDLIEEIARMYGFNNFADTLPDKGEVGFLSLEQVVLRKLRSALRGIGLTELMHYSLGKPGSDRQVVLSNPLFVEYSALRTNLMDGLIEACQYNLERGNGALNGFDIGHIFFQDEDGLGEAEVLGGILGGDTSRGRWMRGGKEAPMTWFEAKGLLDTVFDQLKLPVEYQPDSRDARLHPGRTASLWIRGERLGTFGQLHPQLCQERGLPDGLYVFEWDLDLIYKNLESEEAMVPVFQPFSTYPASDRDLAFYVGTKVSVSDLERAIRKAGGNLLESVELFDEYKGDRVPEGKRSLAFRMVYRTDDRTLTDADVDPVQQKVRDELVEKFQVELRS
ncbi:MAG: phenylalanine--tRNA ligase subunit beta [Alkalinema sp. CACIAM 70d]|nr:MAG: phenylalanine--tRNA ligase subunit beta [Alkalinema sp. CACIAM 70d]